MGPEGARWGQEGLGGGRRGQEGSGRVRRGLEWPGRCMKVWVLWVGRESSCFLKHQANSSLGPL